MCAKFECDSVSNRAMQKNSVGEKNIINGAVTEPKLAPDAVTTGKVKDKNITPEKLSESVLGSLVMPVTDSLDKKYQDITNELYSMIESLQVGGVALSQQFGDRTDIGISQKTLTKALGKFWQEMSNITGKTYMDFTLSVTPAVTFSETSATINITADCSESISDFDSIRIYVDDELVAESNNQEVFTASATIDKTSAVKAVGVILGKTITKTMTAVKEIPFFMGSGQQYTDVINTDCLKKLVGTLEGDYDAEIKHEGDYLFVIIPISRKEEFRRCKMDMSGIEIPFTEEEMPEYIVCKSVSTFHEGIYNIDIDINT